MVKYCMPSSALVGNQNHVNVFPICPSSTLMEAADGDLLSCRPRRNQQRVLLPTRQGAFSANHEIWLRRCARWSFASRAVKHEVHQAIGCSDIQPNDLSSLSARSGVSNTERKNAESAK
jgi:hypothetical protein